ncbi:MAG: hypothetical protein KGM49_15165, partial [Sphingomonadales bacterium]|nr:hypothetical protein [Sphingomonadales bacterium]
MIGSRTVIAIRTLTARATITAITAPIPARPAIVTARAAITIATAARTTTVTAVAAIAPVPARFARRAGVFQLGAGFLIDDA